MADSNEPKKETVRIALPPKPQPPGSAGAPETARIHLPARPPMTNRPMPPPLAQTPLPPAPTRPISAPPSAAPLMPRGAFAGAAPAASMPVGPKKETARISVPGPKKETARITVLPDLPSRPAPTVQMKKTQPLSRMPEPIPPSMPLNVAAAAPEPEAIFDEVPMPFCWASVGVSAVILIIQIWTYIS